MTAIETTGSQAAMEELCRISLKPLCRVQIQLGERILMPDTPSGMRITSETVSLTFEGERLKASLRGRAAADWLVISDNGRLGAMDVRLTAETDDGALIFVQYNGRMRYATDESPHVLYVAPRFETGHSKYAWLNGIQAVGKGFLDQRTRRIDYQFYELV
jgi:hypothetical protein